MELPQLKQALPGAQDQEKVMKLFAGPDGKLKMYLAPADEHTVVMAYMSEDNLREVLEFNKSQQPGLAKDANVSKVASALPAGSQFVGYVSLGGIMKIAREFVANMPNTRPEQVPDFPESPPLGFAAKFDASGGEGHTVIMADTLRSIGDVVKQTRQKRAAERGGTGQPAPQQQQ